MSRNRPAPASLGEITAGNLKSSAEGLKRLASSHPSVRHIVDVIEHLQKRPYATNAIIGGEPGTGKEGLAHTLHELMHPDAGAPLITVSTSGRPEAEIAEELFGTAARVKGERPTDGAVSDSDGGTLVLDEVIGLSPTLQRRLLELVKRGAYHREGENRERTVQVSVVAITDGNLAGEVSSGRFRHDLYHKLARLDLVLPPLRERPEDVPAAALWMARRVLSDRGRPDAVVIEGEESAKDAVILRKEAIDTLRLHRWPGNFRELEIVVERALLLYSDGKQVSGADITRALSDPRG
jgi:DNA-binding NtrC family response regulator